MSNSGDGPSELPPAQAAARRTAIRRGFGAGGNDVEVHVFDTIGSTNEWLAERPLTRPTLVTAREQTRGRGRRGRQWSSPTGGLYFSLGQPLDAADSIQPTLSLLVGLSLADALARAGFAGIRVKWPNDLVVDGAKLAGILVESRPTALIVGVGINRSVGGIGALPADRRAIGLDQLGEAVIDDTLLGRLAAAVHEAVNLAPAQATWLLRERWPALDALAGRTIVVEQAGANGLLEGRVTGITADGRLRLATTAGEHCLNAGECRVQGGWGAAE